jgi:hypothetical protein
MAIGADFDEPLPASELLAWEGAAGGGHAGE